MTGRRPSRCGSTTGLAPHSSLQAQAPTDSSLTRPMIHTGPAQSDLRRIEKVGQGRPRSGPQGKSSHPRTRLTWVGRTRPTYPPLQSMDPSHARTPARPHARTPARPHARTYLASNGWSTLNLQGRPEVGIPRIRTVFVNNFFGAWDFQPLRFISPHHPTTIPMPPDGSSNLAPEMILFFYMRPESFKLYY